MRLFFHSFYQLSHPFYDEFVLDTREESSLLEGVGSEGLGAKNAQRIRVGDREEVDEQLEGLLLCSSPVPSTPGRRVTSPPHAPLWLLPPQASLVPWAGPGDCF